MKKRKIWLSVFGVLAGITVSMPCLQSFNGDTHRYVTEQSLRLVSEIDDHKDIVAEDDKKYFTTIADYSLKPDEDEIEGAYKFHFYNPATETNFMGEKNSALVKCVFHYENAINSYRKNDKSVAFQELGRAIHFMEDLNTPVHVGYNLPTDAVLKFPLHVRFEKVCDSINKECQADVLSYDTLKYFGANSVSTIAKSSAILASGGYYRLSNGVGHESNEDLAKNAVLNAQYRITGLVYKFFNQVRGC